MKHTITFLILSFVLAINAQNTPVLLHQNVANFELYPASIAYYNGEVYFPDFQQNRIVKTSAATTNAPIEVVVPNVNFVTSVEVLGDELYFTQAITTGNPTNNSGKISKINLTQANPTVEDVITGLNIPFVLTGNGSELYFTEIIGTFASNDIDDLDISSMQISRISLTGTPSKTVVLANRNTILDISWGDAFIYWIEEFDTSDQILKYPSNGTSSSPEMVFEFDFNASNEYAERIYYYNNKLLYTSSEIIGSTELGRVKAIELNDTQTLTDVSTPFVFGSNEVYPTAMVLHNNELFVSASSYNFNTDDERELLYKVDVTTLSINAPSAIIPSVQLYPNPATTHFYIESTQVVQQVEVFTIGGKRVLKMQPVAHRPIAISNLQKGMYFVNIQTEQGSITKKLLVN